MALQKLQQYQQQAGYNNNTGRDMRAGQMSSAYQQQSPLTSAAQMYGDPNYQFGSNIRKIYDNAMARQRDGMYKGVDVSAERNAMGKAGAKMTDNAIFQQSNNAFLNSLDPKLLTVNSLSEQGALANGVTQGANVISGGNFAGIGAGVQGVANAGTAALGSAATTGGAVAGQTIGATTGATAVGAGAGTAAAEGAAAAGATGATGATAGLAAAAPWALGALGVYGLGRAFKWW